MQNQKYKTIGRLAPSPTGFLHLGNAWSFFLAWLANRFDRGILFLRMEDIDKDRSKKHFADNIVNDLKWLGLDFDGEIIWQSERFEIYEQKLKNILPLTYSCYCSRKELRDLANAPQKERYVNFDLSIKNKHRFIMPDLGAPYLGTCRNLTKQEQEKLEKSKNACIRIACPPFVLPREEIKLTNYIKLIGDYPSKSKEKKSENQFSPKHEKYQFNDLIHGKQEFSLLECGGDFALKRSDGVWSYQMAVSCDDMDMGINQIIRGDDILTSTPRQLYLYSLFNFKSPSFAHIPLLLDENGERLAKRHNSMSLAYLRENKISSQAIINYFAELLNIDGNFINAKHLLSCIKQAGHIAFPWENLKIHADKHGIMAKNFLLP